MLVLADDVCPDRDFFQPSFAPIFFQPVSLIFLGLVLGDMRDSEVGGVVGGVMGSPVDVAGELPLSSVNSLDSEPETVDAFVRYAESRLPVDLLKAADRCDCREGLGEPAFSNSMFGGLPSLPERFRDGDILRSSAAPWYMRSGISSDEVQGLIVGFEPRVGDNEFKNGMSTLSFINS